MLPGMMMGCGVSTFVNTETPVFSPSELFSAGEEGVWYDPSDLSTMWTDTAGTVQVTSNGDVVRRIDDKSGNGVHLTSSGAEIKYKTSGILHWLEFTAGQMVATGSKTKMKFAHGATGYTSCAGIQFGVVDNPSALYPVYSNCGLTSTKTGINGYYDDRNLKNDSFTNFVGRGVQSQQPISAFQPNNIMDANTPLVFSEIVDPANGTVLDRHAVRVNGGSDSKTNTSNYGYSTADASDELTIGGRSSTTDFPMTGRIYQLALVGGQLGSTDRDALESWVAGKTGVILST